MRVQPRQDKSGYDVGYCFRAIIGITYDSFFLFFLELA